MLFAKGLVVGPSLVFCVVFDLNHSEIFLHSDKVNGIDLRILLMNDSQSPKV